MDEDEIREAFAMSSHTFKVRKRAGEPTDGTLAYINALLDEWLDSRVAV